MVDGLGQWLSGSDSPLVDPDRYPPDVHGVIRQQTKVGWKQIMLGRFVREWRRVQGLYSDKIITPSQIASAAPHKRTTEKWLTGLIAVLWDQWYILWEDRNQDLHGRDTQERQSNLRQDVNRQLNEIYANRHFLDPKFNSLLLQNPEAHADHSLQVTINWLRMHAPMFKENMRKVRRLALERVRSIRTYFQPAPRLPTIQ
jgi:hypothetical protein